MKILLTGRGGQLANCLVERCAGRTGLELIAFGRSQLDLERPETLAAPITAASPDVIVNAAAFTAVDLAEEQPELARTVNVDAAGAIAAAARACGARIIQISTDYVFDGNSAAPYREDAPANPLGVYGATKWEGEQQVTAENSDHLIVRTAWLYSPFGRNFVRTMMHLAETQDSLSVVDDQHGNPTSGFDVADGLIAVLDAWQDGRNTGLGQTYHLAGPGIATWFGFAEAIFDRCRALGLPAAQVVPIASADWPTRAARPRNSTLDCSRFEADFGFRAPAWQQSLTTVVGRLGKSLHAI